MTVYIFIGLAIALLVVTLFTLAAPLLRREPQAPVDERAAILKTRLDDIERERASGLIGAAEAEEAAIEAKRAALAAELGEVGRPARALRFAAVSFLAVAPLAVAGIYYLVGSPALINPPPAPAFAESDIASMPEEDRRALIKGMVANLAAKLEENPRDAEGWRMLARSQLVLERLDESAASYQRLFALDAGSLDDWRNYASVFIARAREERFPTDPEFLRALDEIERRSEGDPMALFYRGGAALAMGDRESAAAIWRDLLAVMPADAPVRGTLQDLIADAEKGVASMP
jgi:cytochrome c-type biogenesis protein CcmH